MSILVREIVNRVFTSKTYILYKNGDDGAWLVDIGDIEPIISFCEDQQSTIKGVFLTHCHFDHIYGLPSLFQYFPACPVYTTEFGKKALASDKLNMSRYHETPIVYDGDNVMVLHEKDELFLFEDEPAMRFFETPGHNPGCMTMVLGDLVFTGDAYIPGAGANTQMPYADRELAQKSLDRILKLAEGKRILPGHKV